MYNSIIEQPELCCGCGNCITACPKNCLELTYDSLGFKKVNVNNPENCISCGKCTRVCPVAAEGNKVEDSIFLRYYAQNRSSDVLDRSSSGGVFTALAKLVLERDGVVWGVAMNSHGETEFTSISEIEDLPKLCGSKYVEVNNIVPVKEIKKQLDKGKYVLFTGTPCQVKAVARSLDKKNYPNLILVDLLCYGVQSPNIWKLYLSEINPQNKSIEYVSMRHKKPDWEDYSMKIVFEDGSVYLKSRWKDPYLLSYATNFYNRYSCARCTAKEFPRASDITIGDFWQIDVLPKIPNDINTDRGVSVILVHSDTGKIYIEQLSRDMVVKPIPENVFPNLKQRYSECHEMPENREAFLKSVKQYGFTRAVTFYGKSQTKTRARFKWLKIKRIIKKIIR